MSGELVDGRIKKPTDFLGIMLHHFLKKLTPIHFWSGLQ
jgi:hypothetical protein